MEGSFNVLKGERDGSIAVESFNVLMVARDESIVEGSFNILKGERNGSIVEGRFNVLTEERYWSDVLGASMFGWKHKDQVKIRRSQNANSKYIVNSLVIV